MIDTMPSLELFRTSVIKTDEMRVDRKNNIIFGANLMQIGDLNEGDARDWTVDAETLSQVHQFMLQGNNGTKARYTHPNMSSDGMGSFLGRWKNPTIDGDKLRADLHVADAAFKSPQGDLGTYTMDLAEEDPEAFGVSLAPRIDRSNLDQFRPKTAGEKWPIRVTGVRAGDVVDTPAATTGGFFSLTTVDNRNLPAQATALLDSYFSDAEPDVVTARINGFLATYFRSKGLAMTTATADPPATTPATTAADPPAATVPAVDLAAEKTEAADLAVKAERNRITEIGSLCTQARRPDLAAGFAEKGTSIENVRKELFTVLCAANKPVGDDGGTGENDTPDENSKYKAEFKAQPSYSKSMTIDEYVALRRVDDGLDTLVAGSASK